MRTPASASRAHEFGDAGQRVELHACRAVGAAVVDDAFGAGDQIEPAAVFGVDQHFVGGPVAPRELRRFARDEIGAVLEHDHLVGEPFGFDEMVRAHDDGRPVAGHVADQLQHGVRGFGIETRGRFVEEQQLGFVQHRTRRARAASSCRSSSRRPVCRATARSRSGRPPRGCGRRSDGRGRRARPSTRGCRSPTGGRRARAWPTTTPQRRRTDSPSRSGSAPNTDTVPSSAVIAPVIMRIAVVLPAPLGPSSTVMLPFGTMMVRSRSAGTSAKRFHTLRMPTTSTTAVAGGRGRWRVPRGLEARAGVIVASSAAHPRYLRDRGPPRPPDGSLHSYECSCSASILDCRAAATASSSAGGAGRSPSPRA